MNRKLVLCLHVWTVIPFCQLLMGQVYFLMDFIWFFWKKMLFDHLTIRGNLCFPRARNIFWHATKIMGFLHLWGQDFCSITFGDQDFASKKAYPHLRVKEYTNSIFFQKNQIKSIKKYTCPISNWQNGITVNDLSFNLITITFSLT
jgi:hypothetical protein